MLRTCGGLFCGKYATLTFSTTAPGPLSSARHWMYRALGLRISEFCGSDSGSDQSLQVLSGRAEFPDAREEAHLSTLAAPAKAAPARHCAGIMHRRFVGSICALARRESRKSLPMSPVAASRPFGAATRRVASPSLVSTSSAALRSAVSR